MIRFNLGLLLWAVSMSPVWASDTPRYEPSPSWVLPSPQPAPTVEGSPLFESLDQQTRVADGGSWNYREMAVRALSADALARFGTITLTWQPFHGDIIIHHVDIIRDGQRIDTLKAGQKFTVLRREQRLEQLELDGELTATLQVEGLRVGDMLDYAYSVTSKDPVLKGHVQVADVAMPEPAKIGFARARLLWQTGTPIKWRAHPVGTVAKETDKGGWHDLTVKLPAPKQPELPADAPMRFHKLPLLEATSFASWADVSKTVAPLYDRRGLISADSPLRQEIDRIRATTSDPKQRAAAALTLVQERVRYFLNGMNGGNYTPQAPAQTWATGYGDCKAKTLLLLTILDSLDIEAEPMITSIGLGDYVPDRLPSLAAFNHIFVHAKVGNEDLWLDGTGRGSRLEDLQDPPPFRWVLPVREAGAELVQLPFRAPARATMTVSVTIDQAAGIGLAAPFDATVVLRGAAADTLRGTAAQLDKEHLQQLALASLGGAAGQNAVVVTPKIAFDPNAGTATIDASGFTFSSIWPRQDHRYRYRPSSAIGIVNLHTDRARVAWKDIPVSTGAPSHISTTTKILLPDHGKQIGLEGDPTLNFDAAGRTLVRNASLADGVITIQEDLMSSGIELAGADLPIARAKIAAAQNRMVRLATTTDYAPSYSQIAAAKREHKLDKLAALFTAWIADKPEDANRYRMRAAFYMSTFQWPEATADLDKAIAIDGNVTTLLERASLRVHIGEKAKAAEDYKAVLALDPSSRPAATELGVLEVDAGQKATALAAINALVDNAGEDRPEWLGAKAQVLARAKDADGALAALDEAIAAKPGAPGLLNNRCWTKATLNVQLDTALQDCTRSIELSGNNAPAFDSRALTYFRLHRLPEALADANAALDIYPNLPSSLFLRAIIEQSNGDRQQADKDLAAAKTIAPQIVQDYARWDIQP
jgi:tetratricopeptide (TPR) repeat protein